MTVNYYCSLGLAFWGVFHFEAEERFNGKTRECASATGLGSSAVHVLAEFPGLGWLRLHGGASYVWKPRGGPWRAVR